MPLPSKLPVLILVLGDEGERDHVLQNFPFSTTIAKLRHHRGADVRLATSTADALAILDSPSPAETTTTTTAPAAVTTTTTTTTITTTTTSSTTNNNTTTTTTTTTTTATAPNNSHSNNDSSSNHFVPRAIIVANSALADWENRELATRVVRFARDGGGTVVLAIAFADTIGRDALNAFFELRGWELPWRAAWVWSNAPEDDNDNSDGDGDDECIIDCVKLEEGETEDIEERFMVWPIEEVDLVLSSHARCDRRRLGAGDRGVRGGEDDTPRGGREGLLVAASGPAGWDTGLPRRCRREGMMLMNVPAEAAWYVEAGEESRSGDGGRGGGENNDENREMEAGGEDCKIEDLVEVWEDLVEEVEERGGAEEENKGEDDTDGPAHPGKAMVAFANYGRGWVGYIGDLHPDEVTAAILLSMLGLDHLGASGSEM